MQYLFFRVLKCRVLNWHSQGRRAYEALSALRPDRQHVFCRRIVRLHYTVAICWFNCALVPGTEGNGGPLKGGNLSAGGTGWGLGGREALVFAESRPRAGGVFLWLRSCFCESV